MPSVSPRRPCGTRDVGITRADHCHASVARSACVAPLVDWGRDGHERGRARADLGDPVAVAARARVTRRARTRRDRPVPAGVPRARCRLRRRGQRGPAHADLLPRGPGVRPAGDGSALRPSRATRPADRQCVGVRSRRCRLRAGPDASRPGPRPARPGVRRRRGHGHRAGDHRRRGDRPCGGQGVHADDHGRRRRAGAGSPGGRAARRPHRLARDALDRRRAVRRDAGRRPARDPRDASRGGTAAR